MANLAIVGSHSTNGVAAIHSSLLRATTVRDLAEMFPERFNNKTNGVTPRRWLLMANPGLSHVIADAIGQRWTTDGGEIAKRNPSPTIPPFDTHSDGPSATPKPNLPTGWTEIRTDGESRQHLRLSGQAHSRIQATDAQRAPHRGPVQSIASEPEP